MGGMGGQGMMMTKRGSQNGGGGGSGRKPEGRKIVVISGIAEKVELHSAENAWKPAVKLKAGGAAAAAAQENGEQDPMAELSKKTRSILNKLCPQKFDVLVEKFNDLAIDTEEKLQLVMELVFEKVILSIQLLV